ncbi:M23 family metallopeptidase [Segetibacter sp. 3557_3]|uniref:M23 family metallopeptidase n=1 Tax=Segetibacter sp. 3557_3 TaxID=2547429 RepID=UPI001058FE41|nr:M23 family metallopeptidase [Segetibacter sp. 3557_3]TDH27937.1 M23 family metallopeptidase [Segetibacter sp. 3557_3]
MTKHLTFSIASLLFAVFIAGCATSKDPYRNKALRLQKRLDVEDTSYLYALPYAKGKSHLVVQAYFGTFTHKNRAAIDFKMKEGTKIYAVRDGVVVRLEERNTKGGNNKRYRQYANLLVIAHDDGTRAGYWHLKQNGALVNMGDTIKKGQLIALSGKTGYAAFPHLHFLVWSNNNNGWQQVPTRFNTGRGPRYLRPFRWYRNK